MLVLRLPRPLQSPAQLQHTHCVQGNSLPRSVLPVHSVSRTDIGSWDFGSLGRERRIFPSTNQRSIPRTNHDIASDIKYKRLLTKVDSYVFTRRSKPHTRIKVSLATGFSWGIKGQVSKCSIQFHSVFSIKCNPFSKIDTTADNISCSECGTISLPCPLTTERMPIISMIPPRVWLPTW